MPQPVASSLLVRGGLVLDPNLGLERADILVRGDAIARIAAAIEEPADRVVDGRGCFVMPGLINAHTHGYQSVFRGLSDNLPLDPWLLFTLGSDLPMGPRETYVATALEAIEMVRGGTTAALDHAYAPLEAFEAHLDAVAAAYRDVGLRACVVPLYADRDFVDTFPRHLVGGPAPPPAPDPARTRRVLDAVTRWLDRGAADRHPRLSRGVGPASPQRCSRELYEGSLGLARARGLALHTHLLETKGQVLTCTRMFGKPVVEYLGGLGALGPDCSFAHGVWLDRGAVGALAEAGSPVVHNPTSNLRLGSGVAPVQAMRAAGLSVALGSDGSGCSGDAGMIGVVRSAARLHKLYGKPEDWIGAAEAWAMCLTGGARVLRADIGRLAAGARADLVLLDAGRVFLAPKAHVVNQIIYGVTDAEVRRVFVGGEEVVTAGRVATVDEAALREEAGAIVRRVIESLPRRQTALAGQAELLARLAARVDAEPLGVDRRVSMIG
jgi:guanine deaminase